jgi:hypothetical protein
VYLRVDVCHLARLGLCFPHDAVDVVQHLERIVIAVELVRLQLAHAQSSAEKERQRTLAA